MSESPTKKLKMQSNEFDSDSSSEEEPGDTDPLVVDFMDIDGLKGRLGATELPGGRLHGVRRSIQDDMQTLKDLKVRHVFALVTDAELKREKVPRLFSVYDEMGFSVHRYPIIDGNVPTDGQIDGILGEIHDLLECGEDCIVHCLGGLGRTGVILAAYLLRYQPEKWSAETAIERIRQLRGPRAIQTVKQFNHLHEFK